jgi:hypothetical protein
VKVEGMKKKKIDMDYTLEAPTTATSLRGEQEEGKTEKMRQIDINHTQEGMCHTHKSAGQGVGEQRDEKVRRGDKKVDRKWENRGNSIGNRTNNANILYGVSAEVPIMWCKEDIDHRSHYCI